MSLSWLSFCLFGLNVPQRRSDTATPPSRNRVIWTRIPGVGFPEFRFHVIGADARTGQQMRVLFFWFCFVCDWVLTSHLGARPPFHSWGDQLATVGFYPCLTVWGPPRGSSQSCTPGSSRPSSTQCSPPPGHPDPPSHLRKRLRRWCWHAKHQLKSKTAERVGKERPRNRTC